MSKLAALFLALAFVHCGQPLDASAPEPRSAEAICPGCLPVCDGTPTSCGDVTCVDCTAEAPPGTDAVCAAGKCVFPCADGFHKCGAKCLSDTSPNSCGGSCTPCPAPPNAIATCIQSACDFSCVPGFVKSGAACLSQSFVSSY